MASLAACSPSRYRHALMTAYRARVSQAVLGLALLLCTLAGAHLALLTYVTKTPPSP